LFQPQHLLQRLQASLLTTVPAASVHAQPARVYVPVCHALALVLAEELGEKGGL